MAGFGPMYVMSIAPANSASIAEGPALKVFQSIVTLGPMRFSNQLLALPTMAWACVMLGNAQTRLTLCAEAVTRKNNKKIAAIKPRLVMPLFPTRVHHQRQHAGLSLFLFAAPLLRTARRLVHQIGQGSVVEDLDGRIAHVEKYLVEDAVISIVRDQAAQLVGVGEWSERTVNQADDFAQPDFRGGTT